MCVCFSFPCRKRKKENLTECWKTLIFIVHILSKLFYCYFDDDIPFDFISANMRKNLEALAEDDEEEEVDAFKDVSLLQC